MLSRLAAAGLTPMFEEVAAVRPPLPKLRLIVSAILYARLVNVTKPPTAVALVVPCKRSLPEALAALTTVALSVVRRFPN